MRRRQKTLDEFRKPSAPTLMNIEINERSVHAPKTLCLYLSLPHITTPALALNTAERHESNLTFSLFIPPANTNGLGRLDDPDMTGLMMRLGLTPRGKVRSKLNLKGNNNNTPAT